MDRTVFLDRDGVINIDPMGRTDSGYVVTWEEFQFIPGVVEAVRILSEHCYRIAVISNQQGVGKGLFDIQDLQALTDRMLAVLEKEGGCIEKVYYCTHLEEQQCSCRKPGTGLFSKAFEEMDVKEPSDCYYVGDTERDMIAGERAGLRTVAVLSGKSDREDIARWVSRPYRVCEDLLDAARFMTGDPVKECR